MTKRTNLAGAPIKFSVPYFGHKLTYYGTVDSQYDNGLAVVRYIAICYSTYQYFIAHTQVKVKDLKPLNKLELKNLTRQLAQLNGQ